jgi:regulatory protein
VPEIPREPGDARADASTFVVSSLAARAQSVAEIRRKLASRDVPPQVADVVIDDALALGYLDDAELAHQLARGYRARGYGRHRAAATLRRRGLGPETAEPALHAEFAAEDEAALALAALGRRPVGDPRADRRAVAFLVRRGFGSSAAWAAVRKRSAADEDGA